MHSGCGCRNFLAYDRIYCSVRRLGTVAQIKSKFELFWMIDHLLAKFNLLCHLEHGQVCCSLTYVVIMLADRAWLLSFTFLLHLRDFIFI